MLVGRMIWHLCQRLVTMWRSIEYGRGRLYHSTNILWEGTYAVLDTACSPYYCSGSWGIKRGSSHTKLSA